MAPYDPVTDNYKGAYARPVVDVVVKTATATLTRDECQDNLIVNTGAAGAIVLSLPKGFLGAKVNVLLTAAQDVNINPHDLDIIVNGGTALDPGDAISSDQAIGSRVSLVCVAEGADEDVDASTWNLVDSSGTWTDVS